MQITVNIFFEKYPIKTGSNDLWLSKGIKHNKRNISINLSNDFILRLLAKNNAFVNSEKKSTKNIKNTNVNFP